MSHVKGSAREQALLLPERVDDYVPEDHPVRFIDAFVDTLDMVELGFRHAKGASGKGRPPYDPRDLLKLYLYGYTNRVRSSRALERETHRNLEVIWLMRQLRPDHKTISDFRSRHTEALKGVMKQFTMLCRSLGLFGRLIAIDGSVVRASNNPNKMHRSKKIKERIEQIEEQIGEYLERLDAADKDAPAAEVPGEAVAEALEKLEEQKKACEQVLGELEEEERGSRGQSDPDCRFQRSGGRVVPGYNVQLAVEGESGLIVAEAVTDDASDNQHLQPMCEQAAERLGPGGTIQVVADQGYENQTQIAACEQSGMEMHVDQGAIRKRTKRLFGIEDFHYDPAGDFWNCPGGQRLERKQIKFKRGTSYTCYTATEPTCAGCAFKEQCTTGKYRSLTISEHRELMDRVERRLKERPEVYARRKAVVEAPFGSIKHWMGQGYFLCRGRGKVDAEFTLSCLAYNIKRLLNIVPMERLIAAVAALPAGSGSLWAGGARSWWKDLQPIQAA